MSSNLFAQISNMFGGNGRSTDSDSWTARPKSSAFGSGLPSSSRRGPPAPLGDAWSLPHNYANGMSSPSLASPNSASSAAYPPPGRYPLNGAAADSMSHLAAQSSHHLVAGSDARVATGVSIPSTSFPPLRHTWNRIRVWAEGNYQELKDTLNWPATSAQIEELEYTLGFSLPAAVRESYLCHNGQELESNQSCSDGIFFGLPLLSLEQVADEWRFWRAVDSDPTSGANEEVRQWQSSCPDQWVRPQYSCRGWIPLITDHSGNYIGVDMTPHPSGGGAPGQVIIFGRDFDTKVVLWRGEGEGGWGRFLQYVAEELESGEMWSLEDQSSGSEDEEDGIGYESYFSGGGSGAGRGGGDRGGEGSASFRLIGEYKGWPVLEAWADRSMRCWEEVGLPVGAPAGQLEMPSVRLSGVDENGEALDAGGSGTSAAGFSSPRTSTSSRSGVAAQGSVQTDGPSHPLQGSDISSGLNDGSLSPAHANSRPFSPSMDSASQFAGASPSTRRISDTLSPPPRSSTGGARGKQKQRDPSSGSPAPTARSRVPPPAPAQPLDLPTIDDVRAAKAAALAEHERSAQVSYSELEHSASRLSLGRNGTIRASSQSGGGNEARGSGDGPYDSHRSETLELDSRNSSDGLRRSAGTGGSLADVVVVGEPRPRSSLHSPTMRSPRSSSEQNTSFPPPNVNLLDGSAPNSPALGSGSGTFGQPSPLRKGSSIQDGGSGSGTSTPTRPLPRAVHGAPSDQHRSNSIRGAHLVASEH